MKAHIGIMGNEGADNAAKEGTTKDTQGEITEGGLRQDLKELRKANRSEEGFLCVSGWDRHSATTYSQLRTGKGNLQSWKYLIGKADSPLCRFCNLEEETGEHIVFSCPRWESLRVKRWIDGVLRPWRSWQDLDLKVWRNKDKATEGQDNGGDWVRNFFTQLDLRCTN